MWPLSLVPTEKKAPAYEASALNYLVRAKNFKSDRVRPTNRPVPLNVPRHRRAGSI